MAREKKTKASEQQENTVSVDMAKLILTRNLDGDTAFRHGRA